MSGDTLTIARRLEATNLSREQAEAIAVPIRDSELQALGNLATKADLAQLRGEIIQVKGEITQLKGKLDNLRKEITAELKLLDRRLTIELGWMLGGAIAILATLQRVI